MRKHYPLNSQGAEDAGQLPWKDGVPSTGVEGSYPGQALFVDSEAELLAAIDASGQTRNGADLTQVAQAIGRGLFLGQFGGSANALSAALPNNVTFATLQPGTKFAGVVSTTNTGGVTVAIAGIGNPPTTLTATLLRPDNSALQPGDLPVNRIFEFRYNGSAFNLLDAAAAAATAVQGLKTAPYINLVAGTYTVTVPPGCTGCDSQIWGGGGGGGGVGSTSNGSGSAGGGGGYSFKTITGLTPGQTITLVIGAAGTKGAAGGAGTAGGTTTLGAFHSATGGAGGSPNGIGTGGVGGTGSGGDINIGGGYGSAGASTGVSLGGAGGSAPFGGQGGGGAPGIAGDGTRRGRAGWLHSPLEVIDMQIFAHIVDGAVREVVKLADDKVLGTDLYSAAFAAECVSCAATVVAGMLYDPATKTFAPAPVPVVDLGALKGRLKAQVDADAEALRLTLITPGSGQAMEYQEAYAEAVQVDAAVKANASATFDPAAFPMLSASLGYDLDPETGKATTDIPGEARAVLAAYDAYQKAGAAIRGVRLRAKAAIDAATDAASASAAYAAIAWPKFA